MHRPSFEPFVPVFDFPPYVSFEITGSCPYRCCFCEADLPAACVQSSKTRTLILEEQILVIRKLADAGTFRLFLTGGEPLSNPAFPTLFRTAQELGIAVVTSTNAYLVNAEMMDELANVGCMHLQVSLHGVGQVHDQIVGLHGAYSRVLRNISGMLSRGFDIEIACVGIRDNYESIPDLIGALGGIGVEFVRVLRYVPSHRREMLRHVVPRSVVERTIPRIYEAAEVSGVRVAVGVCPGYEGGSERTSYSIVHPMAHFCQAGKVEMTILPNGDVVPCLSFRNSPHMMVGNIMSASVSDVWNHPAMDELRRLTPADYSGRCGSCATKWICYSARCVALNIGGSIYGDDASCYRLSYDANSSARA